MMKRVKEFSIKTLAVFLSVLLTLLSFPLGVFAQETNNTDTATEAALKEPIEIIEARTADSKRYQLEDGSYLVAQYDTAVHFLDEDGVWQEIDNTLSASGSEISTPNAKIKFAKKTTGNGELFTLHDGNRKLSLALNGANKKVEGQITNHETAFGEETTKLEKMTTLDRLSASVRYEEILADTDLEYVLKGKNIKENIIVKAKGES